jgi:hypothetical protein
MASALLLMAVYSKRLTMGKVWRGLDLIDRVGALRKPLDMSRYSLSQSIFPRSPNSGEIGNCPRPVRQPHALGPTGSYRSDFHVHLSQLRLEEQQAWYIGERP